jgi:hypothetical protein
VQTSFFSYTVSPAVADTDGIAAGTAVKIDLIVCNECMMTSVAVKYTAFENSAMMLFGA